ncbi:MAG: putative peptidoglycan binding protein [Nitrospirae bacterium]|jgi:soluble cytochrome b562|nr:putative peptidoglycan binding protein [Nitrospirota bacterium]
MKKKLSIILAVLFAFSLAACSSGKAPAEQAIKAAEEAFNAAKGEAVKYVPDQAKAVEDALNAAKDSFAKKDYAAATSAATSVAAKAKDLVAAAAAKKDELTKGWEDLGGGLPKMLDAIKSRVDTLAKSRKLPANLDKAKFEGAQSGLAEVIKVWDEANNAYREGNLADAFAKATRVKEKAAEIMSTLGMEFPQAAQK